MIVSNLRALALALSTSAIALVACAPALDVNAPASTTAQLTPSQSDQSNTNRHLAISYGFTLRLPSNEVEAVQQKHLVECRKLRCAVLNTRLDRSNEGRVTARSSLRLPPDSYAAFAAAITAPPIDVTSRSETAEDKSLPILDTERRLEVKIALRERLTAMLRDPGAKTTADIVAIEKELAQVQGDIETATAQRDYLRTTTETVRVDISYNGQAPLVGGVDFDPIVRAVSSIGQTLVGSVATLIWFLTLVVPWLPLVAFLVWIVRRSLVRRRAQNT